MERTTFIGTGEIITILVAFPGDLYVITLKGGAVWYCREYSAKVRGPQGAGLYGEFYNERF